jgi:hypothetical protein
VVSTDGEKSLLLDRTVDDRNEVGDFIAYYSFAAGSGSNVSDRSGNGNDGEIKGSGATWINDGAGSGLDLDGTKPTHVDIGDLTADGPSSVEELTIAITYEHDDGSGIQNLIEHQDSNFAWYIETRDEFGKPHKMEYNIGYNNSPSARIRTGNVPSNETQVLIGTYDGTEMVLYRNGNRIGNESLDRGVALGDVKLGADSDPSTVGQNLDVRIYEVRLYYTAFDSDEVAVITDAMF